MEDPTRRAVCIVRCENKSVCDRPKWKRRLKKKEIRVEVMGKVTEKRWGFLERERRCSQREKRLRRIGTTSQNKGQRGEREGVERSHRFCEDVR